MPASASGQRWKLLLDLHRVAAHAPDAAATVAGRFVGALGSGRDREDHPAAAFDARNLKSGRQRAHLGGPIGLRLRASITASRAIV